MGLNVYFMMQETLQKKMFGYEVPTDSVESFKYSILSLVGEIGEVLEADKRWKNIRNEQYDRNNKLDELVDCMAFMINMILFSGINEEEFAEAFKEKFTRNVARFREEAGRNSSSRWPNIKFCDRIPARQMRSAYENKTTTVLLAKDGYYRQGFMTARILEAIFYGVVPLFPEEFGEEVIKKYAGECALELAVSDYLDVLAVTENFTAEQEYKLEVIEYLREHLKFMDVSYFVDTVLSIYSEYVKGQ